MSGIIVTGTAEVDGQMVTGQAAAEVRDGHRGHGRVFEIEVDARHIIAFAEIVERHAAAFRRDLDRFMSRERRDEAEAGEEPEG